jgi:hypothetical protein
VFLSLLVLSTNLLTVLFVSEKVNKNVNSLVHFVHKLFSFF